MKGFLTIQHVSSHLFLHHGDMKKFIVLILASLFMLPVLYAQKHTAVIYGFRQQSTGGMQKRGDIDESGRLLKKEPPKVFKYAIYLTTKYTQTLHPVQIWIKGKAFSVRAEAKTAAEFLNEDAGRYSKKTNPAIYETAGAIWKLNKTQPTKNNGSNRAKALAAANDVVVLYRMGGKLHYGVLKKFTDLEPALLQ